jgi:uncharacterized membrane protein YecN with MAPEG domain
MPKKLSKEEIYEMAEKSAARKKGFYGHLSTYLVVNIILILIWVASDGGEAWFLWTLGIWTIVVFLHFIYVFVFKIGLESDKMIIEKELEEIKKEQG